MEVRRRLLPREGRRAGGGVHRAESLQVEPVPRLRRRAVRRLRASLLVPAWSGRQLRLPDPQHRQHHQGHRLPGRHGRLGRHHGLLLLHRTAPRWQARLRGDARPERAQERRSLRRRQGAAEGVPRGRVERHARCGEGQHARDVGQRRSHCRRDGRPPRVPARKGLHLDSAAPGPPDEGRVPRRPRAHGRRDG